MLKALAAWRRTRRVKRTLAGYVSAEVVAKLAREPEQPKPDLTTSWLCCLLAQVRDDTPEVIQSNVAKIVPFYVRKGGIIVEMMSSIQLVTYGAPYPWNKDKTTEDFAQARRDASVAILDAFDKDVRIVLFDGEFAVGTIGNNQRLSYTLLAPKFDRFFKALLETEFGSITEIPSLD
jgi:hypothetical protein